MVKKAVVTILVLFVLCFGAYSLLYYSILRSLKNDDLSRILSEKIGYSVSLHQKPVLQIFPSPVASFFDVQVNSGSKQTGMYTLMEVKRVDLNLSWQKLLWHKLSFSKITIVKPHLYLEENFNHIIDVLQKILRPEAARENGLNEIAIEDCGILLSNRDTNLLQIKNIHGKIILDSENKYSKVQLLGIYNNQKFTYTSLVSYDEEQNLLRLNNLELNFDNNSIKGAIQLLSNKDLSLQGSLALDHFDCDTALALYLHPSLPKSFNLDKFDLRISAPEAKFGKYHLQNIALTAQSDGKIKLITVGEVHLGKSTYLGTINMSKAGDIHLYIVGNNVQLVNNSKFINNIDHIELNLDTNYKSSTQNPPTLCDLIKSCPVRGQGRFHLIISKAKLHDYGILQNITKQDIPLDDDKSTIELQNIDIQVRYVNCKIFIEDASAICNNQKIRLKLNYIDDNICAILAFSGQDHLLIYEKGKKTLSNLPLPISREAFVKIKLSKAELPEDIWQNMDLTSKDMEPKPDGKN